MNESSERVMGAEFKYLMNKVIATNNPAIIIKRNDPKVFPFNSYPITMYYLCQVSFADVKLPFLITASEFASRSHISTADEIEELGIGEVSCGQAAYDVIIPFFGIKRTLHLSSHTFNQRILKRVTEKMEYDLAQSLNNKTTTYSVLTIDFWNDDFIRCVSECNGDLWYYKYFITTLSTYEDILAIFSCEPILATAARISNYADLGCHVKAYQKFPKQYRKTKTPTWLKLYMRFIKNR